MRRRQIRIVLYRPRMYKRAVIREKRIKTSVLYSNFSIILLIVYDRDQVIETKFPLDYIIDKKKKKKNATIGRKICRCLRFPIKIY